MILVATPVLLELVNQYDKIGQFGDRKENVMSTTNIAKSREFTKELANLEYKAAVHSIEKKMAMDIGKSIQIGNDKNAYWDLILNGVKVLNPDTLPN